MIYVSLAQSQVNQGKIRPACDILTHACKLDPSNTQCKYYLARNLMLARDFVGALQVAEEVKLQNRFGAHESVIVEGRGVIVVECSRVF